jgi:hypothetical protein
MDEVRRCAFHDPAEIARLEDARRPRRATCAPGEVFGADLCDLPSKGAYGRGDGNPPASPDLIGDEVRDGARDTSVHGLRDVENRQAHRAGCSVPRR